MANQDPYTSFLETIQGRETASIEPRELFQAMVRQDLEALQRHRERMAALNRLIDVVYAAKIRELMIAAAGSYHDPASPYYHTSINCRQGAEITLDCLSAGASGKMPCMSCLVINIAPPNPN